MKALRVIAHALIVIGALNWGLWGLFQFDLVAFLFGGASAPLSRVVYTIVGIAGLYGLSFFGCLCKHCCEKGSGCCR